MAITWKPTTWKLTTEPLTDGQRSLLNAAWKRVQQLLGNCECGKPAEPIGNRERCAECWGKA